MSSGVRWSDEPVGESYDAKVRGVMEKQFEHVGGQAFDGQIINARPDAIDHRDLFYTPRLTEVPSYNYAETVPELGLEARRQGKEGSCTGQALAAVIDLQNIKRFKQGAPVPLRVSARMAYECAKLYDHYPDDGLDGSSIRGAIKGFYHRGICDEQIAQYQAHDTSFEYNKDVKDDARRVVLGSYFRLQHVLNHYHTAISEAGAILCSAMIHSGWERSNVRRNGGRIVLPQGRGATQATADKVELLGGHAFAIVGYDDEGFLVLNSWGETWGGINPVQKHIDSMLESGKFVLHQGKPVPGAENHPPENEFNIEAKIGKLRGVAHWSYDDWSRHVLDAWVLRLAAPTSKEAWYSGGFSSEAELAVEAMTPRSRNVIGHFIHVKDGRYVSEPPYDNHSKTMKTSAAVIKNNRRAAKEKDRYKHLMFYAHGALNTIDHSSARAATMTPVYKRHGIYPMFYFWRTGVGTIASEIIKSQLPEVEPRSQGKQSVINHLLERQVETVGRAIWRDINSNAHDCFYCNQGEENHRQCAICKKENECIGGKGWEATDILLRAAREDPEIAGRPLKIHFVAHSAGALMIGPLLRKIREEYPDDWTDYVDSVTLMAPACNLEYFIDNFAEVAETLGKRFCVLNLPPNNDASIDPTMHPYGKSLLHLVSNAFENLRGTPIAGLDMYWPDSEPESPDNAELLVTDENEAEATDQILWKIRQAIDYRTIDEKITPEPVLHMGYDNNAEVMDYVLRHILNRKRPVERGFDAEALGNGKF